MIALIGKGVEQGIKYAGPIVLAWLFTDGLKSGAEVAKSGEQSVDHIAKAAPWIVGGLVLVLLMQKKGR